MAEIKYCGTSSCKHAHSSSDDCGKCDCEKFKGSKGKKKK